MSWWNLLLFKLFVKLGIRFFPVVCIWDNKPGYKGIRVVHFALSERDLNTSCRDFVEDLDKSNDNTQ